MTQRIALLQMDVDTADVASNIARAARLAEQALAGGASVLMLPEMWNCSFAFPAIASAAAAAYQPAVGWMSGVARQHGVSVVGSLGEVVGEQVYNTLFFFGPDGQLAGSHRKSHLFPLMDEHTYMVPGDAIAAVTLPWGTVSGFVCYDLRFPELARAEAALGAQVLFVSAQWPRPRLAHWQTLLRARAIENQVFVVACNRVGETGRLSFFGHSAVIDPWGEVLVEAGEGEGVFTADVDLAVVAEVRRRLPSFTDRRPGLYAPYLV